MPLILTSRTPWRRRPSGLVQIDQSNWQSVGLAVAGRATTNQFMVTAQAPFSATGSTAIISESLDENGIGWRPTDGGSNGGYLTASSVLGMPASGFTLSAWVNVWSVFAAGAAIKVGNGSTGYGIGLGDTTWASGGTTHNIVGLFENVAWVSSGVSAPLGWRHIALVGNQSSGGTVYLDGRSVYTFGSSAITPSSETTIFGANGVNNRHLVGATLYDVRAMTVPYSDAQVWQLYAPETRWSLYAPLVRRTVFDLGAGGGTTDAVGTATATSAASGVGASTAASVGTVTALATAAAVALAIVAGVGSTVATASAAGVGASIASAVGTCTATSSAVGTAGSIAASVGVASALATASGTGAATAEAVATCTATCTASGTATATAASVGTCAITSTAAGVGEAVGGSSAVGTVTATSTASGVGASTASAVGTATASATATGTGAATSAAVGTAASTSAASGVGASTAASVGTAAATSTAAGVGSSIGGSAAVGVCAITSTATATAASIAAAVGSAAITSTASAVGTTAEAIPPIADPENTWRAKARDLVWRARRR